MAAEDGPQELTPGTFITVNGISGIVTLDANGQTIIVDASNPSNIIGHAAPGSNTQVVPGPIVPTGNGSTTPPAAPAQSSMANFGLPWYPQTFGAGPGTYRNLRDQIGQSLVPHNYNEQQFGRFNFGHGAGPAPTPGSPPGPPVPPQPIPFPQPVPPPGPYVPPPGGGGGGGTPPPPGTNPLPLLGGGIHPPQQPGTPIPRTGTPNGGLLTPAPVNPLLRTGTPAGGLLADQGHAPLPSAGPPNPLLRGSTPSGLLGTPTATTSPPDRRMAASAHAASDAVAPSPNNAGMYGVPGTNDLSAFRFSGQSPQELNYNYLAGSNGPQVAGQYFNVAKNSLIPLLQNQTASTPGLSQQLINTAGAGGTGSQYSGGGQSMDGSQFWTGANKGVAPAGFHPMGFNMYATDLPYASDPYGLAGTPLAGLLSKYAPQIQAAMAAAGKAGTPS